MIYSRNSQPNILGWFRLPEWTHCQSGFALCLKVSFFHQSFRSSIEWFLWRSFSSFFSANIHSIHADSFMHIYPHSFVWNHIACVPSHCRFDAKNTTFRFLTVILMHPSLHAFNQGLSGAFHVFHLVIHGVVFACNLVYWLRSVIS